MRIVRFLDEANQIGYGQQLADGTVVRIAGDIFGIFNSTGQKAQVKKLLSPISPTAILAIGLNYRKHAEETGAKFPEFPVLFMKSPGSIQNPGDPIEIPTKLKSTQVDFEGELAVVIGRRAKNVSREDALKYVLGYTVVNDVSARDWQKAYGGGQFCRGKTFDTFCPMGPAIATTDEIPDPNNLQLRTTLNGELMQDTSTKDMIFDVPSIVSFLSGSTTLLPGTIILTGTPHGVGMARKPPVFMKQGDVVEVEIERIGKLSNPVMDEK